jgi:hypothetical protein
MTDLRRKLIEHEIKKCEELRKMFDEKAESIQPKPFKFNFLANLRSVRQWELKLDYVMMSMDMWQKKLDWRNLLQEQQ